MKETKPIGVPAPQHSTRNQSNNPFARLVPLANLRQVPSHRRPALVAGVIASTSKAAVFKFSNALDRPLPRRPFSDPAWSIQKSWDRQGSTPQSGQIAEPVLPTFSGSFDRKCSHPGVLCQRKHAEEAGKMFRIGQSVSWNGEYSQSLGTIAE